MVKAQYETMPYGCDACEPDASGWPSALLSIEGPDGSDASIGLCRVHAYQLIAEMHAVLHTLPDEVRPSSQKARNDDRA